MQTKLCSVDGCGREKHARGMCWTHDYRVKRFGCTGGSYIRPKEKDGVKKEWLDGVFGMDPVSECITWPFKLNSKGRAYLAVGDSYVFPHVFVCEKVNGPRPTPTHQAAHSCGKGHEGCVNPKHLRWATPKENQADRLLHGTDTRGEKHPMRKLTESDVLAIRHRYRNGGSRSVLAREFSITASHVGAICRRSVWKHLMEAIND